ncbi:MAG: hypothetical protein COA97_04560 [Flavobacteriales bacterium]|nr:MAG: hypothetical protein COA97_04560 [Flavobacteriales bacterium]
MHKINPWSSYLIISLFFFACSGDENSDDSNDESSDTLIENINLPEQLGLDSGEVKMFTMPTPLQIATALRVMNVDYNENLLLENGNIAVASDIDLSLSLGMYLTDLGYTTVYNNTQKSLSYAKDIQYIMEELPIALYVNDGFKKRFNANLENQDSLCKIILDGYNEANQYISETENEGLGLLILTGAYIEGLYIASSSNVSNIWLDEHDNLFIQQKLFLDNFILLLEGYTSNSKIAVVVNKLTKLKVVFDEINVSFNDENEAYELSTPITPASRNKINLLITELRNEIVNNIQIKNS